MSDDTKALSIAPSVDGVDRQTPGGTYRLSDLMLSEWTKLRSVRSTMWTLLATVVIGVGISILATAETRAHWNTTSAIGFDPTALSLAGSFFAQLTIGILGVLVISAEYGTGTIRSTFAASPRRLKVLAAKVIVFGGTVIIVSEFLAFTSFFIGQSLLSAPATHVTLSSPGALRAVIGSGIYLTLMGLFALGLGTILRHTAGAISAYIGALLVVPIIFQALPASIRNSGVRYLPDHIGGAVISLVPGNAFAPWTGILLLVGYAAALLAIGAVLVARRDA